MIGESKPVKTFTPAGYQSYYVLGNSSCIIKEAVDAATGFNPVTAQSYSVFSLVSYQNISKIYVDQKSNGYSFNPEDFTGADAVFQLDKGGVLVLDNWQVPYYEITPVGGGALLSGSLGPVDGGVTISTLQVAQSTSSEVPQTDSPVPDQTGTS